MRVMRWVNDGGDAAPSIGMGLSASFWLRAKLTGVTVPMVSKRHGVPTSRIYSWRGDARFQSDGSALDAFTPVEFADVLGEAVALPEHDIPSRIEVTPAPRVEITLENGRRLSVTDGVDAGFVLELACGLAA